MATTGSATFKGKTGSDIITGVDGTGVYTTGVEGVITAGVVIAVTAAATAALGATTMAGVA